MENEIIETKMHQPACPKCAHEPLEFACNVVKTHAGHLIAVIWCGACGYSLNVQFVGMDQPKEEKPVLVMRPS
jgi:transcription elongation factor Elf1